MSENPYETQKMVNEYLLFHYGAPDEVLPYPDGPREAVDFAVRAVTEMIDHNRIPSHGGRAFDLGCAVGRSSFVLSQWFDETLGIDFSQAFVDAADQLADAGHLAYERVDEGVLTTQLEAKLPAGARRETVRFLQGDAMDLPDDLGSFDLVLMANLLCRLPHPRRCLDRIPDLVNPGGQLIITSPYTWLDEFTPRDEWLGGFHNTEDDSPVVTIDTLTDILGTHFQQAKRRNLPMLIREHSRKFQWTMVEGSLWIRNDT